MKTLIIYQSIHHGNTEKIAKKIGEILDADLKKPDEVKPEDLANYDLIGFGSGIYFSKFHASILKFVDSLPVQDGKKAFIFFTHGAPSGGAGKKFISQLKSKNFSLVGEFGCRGFDTFGPFKIFGGLAKGRPNEKDLSDAAAFAEGLKKI
ncbi:MAG TPA: flavodoxin family protein [Candidatus Nanoarchaeia archaeon]|nr:flavodoxin family protein [Candidatus Nanoarchaeia archaeon]